MFEQPKHRRGTWDSLKRYGFERKKMEKIQYLAKIILYNIIISLLFT